MILDFNSDETQLETLINDVQNNGMSVATIAHLGLLKRALYSLELTDTIIRICSRPTKSLSDTELAALLVTELNCFIRKSEETEA